jgi:type I restriction enzyme S subunit
MNQAELKTGWRKLKLSDVIKVKSGDSLSKSKMEDGVFPVFGGNGITGYHSTYNSDDIKLVIGRVGEYCGAIYKTPTLSWITDNALYVNEKKLDVSDEYLYFLLCYLELNKYANRNAQPLVSGKTLEQVFCTLPSCPIEQQKIVEVLSTVDKKIDLIDQKIAETEKLKTGLMQKLFSEGVGVQDSDGNWQPHSEFQDSPLGEIPKCWEVNKIKNVSPLQGGYAFKSKSASEDGIRWLKIANVGKRKVLWNDINYLPENFAQQHSDFLLNEDDIVIALTRPLLSGELKVARLSFEDTPSLLNQRVARINVHSNLVDKSFVYYLFEDKKMATNIAKAILGTDPPNISTKQIEDFYIPLPPMNEQKYIGVALGVISENITLLKQQKSETQQLKKGLMQKLLTGEWRVPLDNPEAA